MTELKSTSLSNRVASAREGTGERGDLIVVDDQVTTMRSFAQAIARDSHRVHLVDGVRSLEGLLEARAAGEDAWAPMLALVDLDLGADEPTGLEAVRLLRNHPASRDVLVVLNTNVPGSPWRQLLSCLCAEVNGGGILLSTKSDADVTRLRQLLDLVTTTVEAGGKLGVNGPVCDLGHVTEVNVRSTQGNGVLRPLSEVLSGRIWKEAFWSELVRTGRLDDAHAHVMDNINVERRGGIDDLKSSPTELARHDLGHLPTALIEAGADLLSVPDGILDLGLSVALEGRQPRAQRLEAFALMYARVLTDPDLYVEAT